MGGEGTLVDRLRDGDDLTARIEAADEIERLCAALDAAGRRACEWVNGEANPPDVGIYDYVTGRR